MRRVYYLSELKRDFLASVGITYAVFRIAKLRLRAFTLASLDHIFGIILYPLYVKSKMWSKGLLRGLLRASAFFIISLTLAAESLNHNGLKYY